MREILKILKDEGYKWGNCQVLRYDSKRVDVFQEGYISKLYRMCKGSDASGETTSRHANILDRKSVV